MGRKKGKKGGGGGDEGSAGTEPPADDDGFQPVQKGSKKSQAKQASASLVTLPTQDQPGPSTVSASAASLVSPREPQQKQPKQKPKAQGQSQPQQQPQKTDKRPQQQGQQEQGQQKPQQPHGQQQQGPLGSQQQQGPPGPRQQQGPPGPQQQQGQQRPQQQGPRQQQGPPGPQQQQGPPGPRQQQGQQRPQQQQGQQQQGQQRPQQQQGPRQQQGPPGPQQQQHQGQQRPPQQQGPQQRQAPPGFPAWGAAQPAAAPAWGRPQQPQQVPPQAPQQYQQPPQQPPQQYQQPPQQYQQPPQQYQQPPQQAPPQYQQAPLRPQQAPPQHQQAPQRPQQATQQLQQAHVVPQQVSPTGAGGSGDAQGAKRKSKGKGGDGQKGADKKSLVQATLPKQMAKMEISPQEELKPMHLVQFAPGTRGRVIKVETNHLALNLGKLKTAIHYDVAIDPDKPKKNMRTVMELFRQQHYPNRYPAFDGRKNLYSTNLLPFGMNISGEVILTDSTEGRQRPYKVEIKFATEVDLTPLSNYDLSRATPREALQVVDIVLRSAPAMSLIAVGQSFFTKPEQIIDLGEGMEMYQGFYQSTIRGWKPFLNVDVAHKAFPKCMPVIDALIDVCSSRFKTYTRNDLSRPIDQRDMETFEKYMRTLRVIYEIPGIPSSKRGYRVNGFQTCAADKSFQPDNGPAITIAAYFQNQKRYKLRYPNLPTLWVGDRQRPNPILLPMELCNIEAGQVLNRKMTENQTATMIKSSATNTDIRKQKIQLGVDKANYNGSNTVREFGFSVSSSFEKLDARVLPSPELLYEKNQKVRPSRGQWRGARFIDGARINNWTIAVADRRAPRQDEINRLADELFNQAGSNGLMMRDRAEKPFDCMGVTQREIRDYFQKNKGKFDVIFCVVPNSGQQYSYVKTAAEINVGCLTQCIKSRTMQRINAQTAINILLKVNAKLNGVNHALSTRPPILNRPTMIMGADVTHPSPDAKEIPSVAAVTASHDPRAFKYNICWRLQPPRQELIDDLENITVEHLYYFYKMNKQQKPERIIVFRDGVSEGYFEEIRRAEIRAIRSACKRVQAEGFEPTITFLVVQKRHHTRLFPMNPRDSEDRNNNVPAGTCVDKTITHPFMQDFYLVSHASIQGVAKPTKYCTLWDDNNLSNDDIEELTYFLCHMFSRCNRSVSYPAPTYYAHLAAARAKVYIENTRLDLNDLRREYEKFQILDVIRKDKPMFFV